MYGADLKTQSQEDMNPIGSSDTDSFKEVRYYLIANIGTTRQQLDFTLQFASNLFLGASLLFSAINLVI